MIHGDPDSYGIANHPAWVNCAARSWSFRVKSNALPGSGTPNNQ
jgi:hypothetical protein